MNLNALLLGITLALLIIIDFFTFHDVFEPHTFKDWLILAVSITFFTYVARVAFQKVKQKL